jgi:sulfide:quinone oxidoreductase
MVGKRVVILGGGFGGAAVARTLRKLLGSEHTVTLVDRIRRTYLCGSLPLLVVGKREPQKISRSLGSLIQRGVKYIQAEVANIEINDRRLRTSIGSLPFDYLVIATGAEYNWDIVPGSSQCHSFYNLYTACKLRDTLRHFRGGRVVIAISRLPYKCPPAPFEASMLMEQLFKEKGIRNEVEMHIFSPEPMPLKIVGPKTSAVFKNRLASKGITLHEGETISYIDPDSQRATFQSGETIDYNLMITVPAHQSPEVIREAGLLNDSGWVPVDPATLATQHDRIYAIGDVASLPMANGLPLPKAGVFASGQGETVARNLAAEIHNDQKTAYLGEGYCFIDHGDNKVALIRGRFLADGKPDVQLTSASGQWHRKKIRFESDWRHWKV